MKKFLILSFLLMFSLLLTACGSKELEDTVDWDIHSFETTTQAEKPLTMEDMKGKVWLADFIFTSCETVCPPMTRNMSQIQDQLEEEGIEAEIVSFSVDPNVDTPQKLKEFGKKYGADFNNWSFVTGYSQEEIETFAKESFKAIAHKPEGVDQVSHGASFYLINKEGTIVKHYKGTKDVPYEQIVEDTKIAAD